MKMSKKEKNGLVASYFQHDAKREGSEEAGLHQHTMLFRDAEVERRLRIVLGKPGSGMTVDLDRIKERMERSGRPHDHVFCLPMAASAEIAALVAAGIVEKDVGK